MIMSLVMGPQTKIYRHQADISIAEWNSLLKTLKFKMLKMYENKFKNEQINCKTDN